MERKQHTQGPWEFVSKITGSENHKGFFIRAEKVTRNGKWALAEVQPGDEDGKLGESNARLISASPDLYAALKEFTEGRNNANAMTMAYAAIAKAEGNAK